MVTDTTWFILVVWIGLLAFGRKEQIIAAFGSFLGLFFGLILMIEVNVWIGIIIIFLNFYLLYKAIFEGKK